MSPHPDSIPYTLRLGVTGHRALADPEAVHWAVATLLDRIEHTLTSASANPRGISGTPKTWGRRLDAVLVGLASWVWPSVPRPPTRTPPEQQTPLRWTIISPLAKGADRIVARAVLARPDANLEVVDMTGLLSSATIYGPIGCSVRFG